MNRNRPAVAHGLRVLVIALGLAGGCQERARPERAAAAPPPRAPAEAAPAGATLAAPAAPTAAEPPARALVAGEWIETASFRFRVTGVQRCRGSRRARTAASGQAARTGSDASYLQLAVAVQIEALYDHLFVSPRDLALERSGVAFASEIDPGRDAGCGRLLGPQSLRRGQSATGAVVFVLPEADARESLLVFAPTRWGGAPRVALAMPACLDACGRARKGG